MWSTWYGSHPPLYGDQELVLQVMRALLQPSHTGGSSLGYFTYLQIFYKHSMARLPAAGEKYGRCKKCKNRNCVMTCLVGSRTRTPHPWLSAVQAVILVGPSPTLLGAQLIVNLFCVECVMLGQVIPRAEGNIREKMAHLKLEMGDQVIAYNLVMWSIFQLGLFWLDN